MYVLRTQIKANKTWAEMRIFCRLRHATMKVYGIDNHKGSGVFQTLKHIKNLYTYEYCSFSASKLSRKAYLTGDMEERLLL